MAGLQAIATSRRLGGVVQAYDVRPEVREQVESLGARFLEIELDTSGSEGRRRLRQGPGGRILPPAARDDGRCRKRQRRGHHNRGDSRQAGPGADHRGDGPRDALGFRGPGPGGRRRRELRAHSARRDRGGGWRERSGALEPPLDGALPREPDVCEKRHGISPGARDDGEMQIDMDNPIVSGTLIAHEGEVVNSRLRELLDVPTAAATTEERSSS